MTPEPQEKEILFSLWNGISATAEKIRKDLDLNFRRQFNLTLPQVSVLRVLSFMEVPMSMGRLAPLTGTSNGNVTGIVTRLKARRLIKKSPAKHDRRTYLVSITDEGMIFWRAVEKQYTIALKNMFKEITEEEVIMVLDGLRKIK